MRAICTRMRTKGGMWGLLKICPEFGKNINNYHIYIDTLYCLWKDNVFVPAQLSNTSPVAVNSRCPGCGIPLRYISVYVLDNITDVLALNIHTTFATSR
jgi:hypothetical protein